MLAVGESLQFDAIARDPSGQPILGVKFSWLSSDLSVISVDADGVAIGMAPGTATVTAAFGPTTSNPATLLVEQAVRTIAVSPPAGVARACAAPPCGADSVQFVATAADALGNPISGIQFSWSASDPSVTIDPATGLASGSRAGEFTVTASAGGGSGSAILKVDIGCAADNRVASIVLFPVAVTGRPGTQQFTAQAHNAAGDPLCGVPFNWSANPRGVTVSPAGLVTVAAESPFGRYDVFADSSPRAAGGPGRSFLIVRLFHNPRSFPTGNLPQAAAAADFNGDLIPDLAVANLQDNSISILLQGAGPTFTQPRPAIPVGASPISVAAGSFNPRIDQTIDLAVANLSDNTLFLLINDGLGSFGVLSRAEINGPFLLLVDDFDRDGNQEIVVDSLGDGSLHLLGVTEEGSVSERGSFSAGVAGTAGLLAADLDGDMRDDLITVNHETGRFSVRRQISPLRFEEAEFFQAGVGPQAIAAGDFDGDGKTDLAIANEGRTAPDGSRQDGSLQIFLGGGDGRTFGAPLSLSLPSDQPYSLAAGRFFSSDRDDLVLLLKKRGGVVLVTFAEGALKRVADEEYFVGKEPVQLLASDLDRDGRLDLVSVNSGSHTIAILVHSK